MRAVGTIRCGGDVELTAPSTVPLDDSVNLVKILLPLQALAQYRSNPWRLRLCLESSVTKKDLVQQ